jgi:hypothetical protein
MGVIEVWREPSQLWRWRYVEPPSGGSDPLELLSNEVYGSSQEAIVAATTAYPGTPVLELDRPPGAPVSQPGGAGLGRRIRTWALLGVAVALLAMRVRRRRRRRAPSE